MFKTLTIIPLAVAAIALASCSNSIDLPKGTSKGYTSARLVKRNPGQPATNATEAKVHHMIQKSLAASFSSHGLAYGKGDTDLTVAYLVIYQEPGMTARYDEFFGYGRDVDQITDHAHTRGALENKRPDYFQRAGILIDVIDSRTHKLVYRNFATGDVVRGASDATRAARIDSAVAQALTSFFGKP